MVIAQLFNRDVLLLFAVGSALQNVTTPPCVSRSGSQDAAHEMVGAIGVGKCVEITLGRNLKFLAGDEDGTGGTDGDVAAAFTDGAGTNSGGGVIACACCHNCGGGDAEQLSHFGLHGSNILVAFKQLTKLLFHDTTVVHHRLGPAAVCHIKKQHAGSIGVIAAMYARQTIYDIVLGEHDAADLCKEFRFILTHPKKLGCGKACEGQVASQFQQLLHAEVVVDCIGLCTGSAVVPEDRGTDDLIVLIQSNEAMHLTAYRQASNLRSINTFQQLGHTNTKSRPPLLGILFGPAGLRHHQGIALRSAAKHLTGAVNQKDLHGRSAQIYTEIKHRYASFLFLCLLRDFPEEAE